MSAWQSGNGRTCIKIRVKTLSWSVINNFKNGFNGDYRVKLTPSKIKVLCEVDWSAFGLGWPLEPSLDKTVVNEVYRVIVKKKKKRKTLTPRRMGKAKRLKLVFNNKQDSIVYLNSGSNLLGRLKRNQNLPVLMGSFGAPKIRRLHIFTQNGHPKGGLRVSTN
jgi:hypothetical protein